MVRRGSNRMSYIAFMYVFLKVVTQQKQEKTTLVLRAGAGWIPFQCNVPKVVDGLLQSFLEGHVRLPVQRALGEADVRPALLRVILKHTRAKYVKLLFTGQGRCVSCSGRGLS